MAQKYEFLIVGGGVIGLSIARELHKRGARSIGIVERGPGGREASWAAAGILAPNAETEQIDDLYRFCSEANELYPQFVAELLDETGVDIEFRRSGTFELAFSDEDTERLSCKYNFQREAGIDVESLSALDILKAEPCVSSEVITGLHYSTDGHVENRKLLEALLEYARRNRIELIEDTEITELNVENGKVTGARTAINAFIAETTILATGAWSSLIKFGGVKSPLEVKPIRGQMIAFQGEAGLIEKVIYGSGAYLVPRADGRILAGATVEDAGFEKVVTVDAVKQLRDAAITSVPRIAEMELTEKWCGLRPFAADGLPIIGEIDGFEDLMVATAHFRNGILLAPITAKIVAERMTTDFRSPYFDRFNARRFAAAATAVVQ